MLARGRARLLERDHPWYAAKHPAADCETARDRKWRCHRESHLRLSSVLVSGHSALMAFLALPLPHQQPQSSQARKAWLQLRGQQFGCFLRIGDGITIAVNRDRTGSYPFAKLFQQGRPVARAIQ